MKLSKGFVKIARNRELKLAGWVEKGRKCLGLKCEVNLDYD